jgi:small GTP-binding protein
MTDVARRHKVVLLGNTSAGKTAVVYRAMTGRFPENAPATIDKAIHYGEFRQSNSGCIFEVWDTAGQEQYKALTKQYARDARGAILVFDVTDRSSFEALRGWVELLRDSAPDVQVVIFANKTDLSHQRTVTTREADAFADDIAAVLVEGSARTGQNVRSIFQMLAANMRDAPASQPAPHVDIPRNVARRLTATSQKCSQCGQ